MTPDDPLEQSLRDALRPVDPGADFTLAVARRVGREQRVRRRWRVGAWSGALAASLLLAFTLGIHIEQQRELQRAQYAREQLWLALEVTNRQLQAVQRRLERAQSQLPQENGT